MKEYLEKQANGEYVLIEAHRKGMNDWTEVPDGAECLTVCDDEDKNKWYLFWRGNCKFCVGFDNDWHDCGDVLSMAEYLDAWDGSARIVWQRPQQPESLPFIDDEVQSINDQYAEIEQVRQAKKYGTVKANPDFNFGAAQASGGARDNVNHPNHYADSAIECIDAMEAMMTPEQFIGYLRGNLLKYQWRYEKKNGIEDLRKAQWYLEKLTVKVAEKNAPF